MEQIRFDFFLLRDRRKSLKNFTFWEKKKTMPRHQRLNFSQRFLSSSSSSFSSTPFFFENPLHHIFSISSDVKSTSTRGETLGKGNLPSLPFQPCIEWRKCVAPFKKHRKATTPLLLLRAPNRKKRAREENARAGTPAPFQGVARGYVDTWRSATSLSSNVIPFDEWRKVERKTAGVSPWTVLSGRGLC